ncbi:hypothetical protein BST89_24870, partial [Salmonella enterica subsp. enterica serovar Typhi]
KELGLAFYAAIWIDLPGLWSQLRGLAPLTLEDTYGEGNCHLVVCCTDGELNAEVWHLRLREGTRTRILRCNLDRLARAMVAASGFGAIDA